MNFLSSPLKLVQNKFEFAFKHEYPDCPVDVQVTPSKPKFGDYQTNAAIILYKTYKSKLNVNDSPESIAKNALQHIEDYIFSDVVVSNQGFISVKLGVKILKNILLNNLMDNPSYIDTKTLKVIVDFSSPNIAKQMHVGHLRSTLLGETICRLLESCGHSVMRINHLGDWGTQFGMLIQYMKEYHPDFDENPLNLADVTNLYKEAKKKFDVDPDFKKKSQLMVTALQNGDTFAVKTWKTFCQLSEKEFQEIYDRFGISLINRGESFYNDMIPSIIDELERQNMITISDGAKCLFVDDDPIPLIVMKSDGAVGYDSTDLAAAKHRLVDENYDWLIYVTDVGQSSHFDKIFKASKKIGWYSENKKCTHIPFGFVQGEDGKKMKTRAGDQIKLIDLLDEAVSRAYNQIIMRSVETNTMEITKNNLSTHIEQTNKMSKLQIAQIIGYSSVRYFDIHQNRLHNYKFSYDKMLDSKGKTAVYLLYTYARIRSIIRKSNTKSTQLNIESLSISNDFERQLLFHLSKFNDTIEDTLRNFCLHLLADYTYKICTYFSDFYENCPILNNNFTDSRLIICQLASKYLEKTFYLLGITPLEQI